MTTNPGPTTPAGSLSDFHAAQASLSLELRSAVRVDSFQVIAYAQGQFSLRTQVINGPSPLNVRVLTPPELRELGRALRAEAHNPPADLDVTALHTFIEVLSEAVEEAASTRFDHARFGNVTTDPSGALVGHLGFGVDVVGTIHDASHDVTFEQHPLPLPPGHFRHLTRADRASLARALTTFIATASPPADPLWSQILSDVQA